MRTVIAIFVLMLLAGCSNSAVEKPHNLIDEDTMVDIFYDLSVLEALRAHNPDIIQKANDPNHYIYKKYHVDSLQFAKSNRFYATDIKHYKKMYERVGRRLERDLKSAEAGVAKPNEKLPENGGMVK